MSTISWGQTQMEMNQQAYEHYQKVDQELNKVYQQILNLYKSDTAFIQNLKVAQRIWIQYRDAELRTQYPEREPGYYGSVYPMNEANYLAELTEERINKLSTWITGTKEGDVCAGSEGIK